MEAAWIILSVYSIPGYWFLKRNLYHSFELIESESIADDFTIEIHRKWKRHCQWSRITQVRMRWLFLIVIWIVTFLPSHFIHVFSFVYWTTSCLQQKTINCLAIVWHAQEISRRTAKHVFIYSFLFSIEFHLNLSPFQGSFSYFLFSSPTAQH